MQKYKIPTNKNKANSTFFKKLTSLNTLPDLWQRSLSIFKEIKKKIVGSTKIVMHSETPERTPNTSVRSLTREAITPIAIRYRVVLM